MRPRVLVTRPEPGASATATALAGAGFEPVILPLTRIVPLRPDLPSDPGRFDAVVATSANAVRNSPPKLARLLAGTRLFAVGAATAAAAREAGFGKVAEGPGDAEGLARHIAATLPPGSRLLYLAGRIRRPEMESLLAEAGMDVAVVETYSTEAAGIGDVPPGRDRRFLAVLVHSAGAAKAYSALIQHSGFAAALRGTPCIAISARAAAPLPPATETLVAERPTDDAMIEKLRVLR